MKSRLLLAVILTFTAVPAMAVPPLLNHQGRVAVNGATFEGTGHFKFALVSGDGSVTRWSHDGTSTGGSEPASAVDLPVVRGLYSVPLGDTGLPNMGELPRAVFADNNDTWLRVWFDDGSHGSQQIVPDQHLTSVPWAMLAAEAETMDLANIVAAPDKPVLAWGRNTGGQTSVPALAGVTAIAAGDTQSLALLQDGTVSAWGAGTPVPVGLSGVTAISARADSALARLSDGSVRTWGSGPAVPGDLPPTTQIAAGRRHSVALLADGTVRAWGDNTFLQTSVPPGLSGVKAIAAGYDHTLALTTDGHVIAWGRNDSLQTDVPGTLTGVTSIAAGAFHSLAVKADGSVVAWGWNSGGQSTVPSGLSGVTAVAGGYAFSAAILSDGTLRTWGDNADGQRTVPAAATSIAALAAGASHLVALHAPFIPAQVARLDQDNVFTGRTGLGRVPAANRLEVDGQASKTTAGNWLSNSDRRIKTGIAPVTGALEKLERVRLVDFRYTSDYLSAHPSIEDKRYLNVIAQEFAEVFPDDVKSSGETLPDGSPILQVDTYPLTIYSAAAVQELHRENEALNARLTSQEERLRKLEALLTK